MHHLPEAAVFDDTRCFLGEGPLWHPERRELFWFDVLNDTLFSRSDDRRRQWRFDEHVSAGGWIDAGALLIASERRLARFEIRSGSLETLVPLEADDPTTRSNDGRTDPWGGFWIGTMGKSAEPGAGAIYRFHRGELRRLHASISIPNATCFSPDGLYAYFTDLPTSVIRRQPLDEHGWPAGEADAWLDLRPEGLSPDGAVIDADGNLWNAQWGAGRVAAYDPSGTFIAEVPVPAPHTSCPAFGGDDQTTLFCTTAQEHMTDDDLASHPLSGMTFRVDGVGQGRPEYRVSL
jgi:sugar lactone lactonase YvrE